MATVLNPVPIDCFHGSGCPGFAPVDGDLTTANANGTHGHEEDAGILFDSLARLSGRLGMVMGWVPCRKNWPNGQECTAMPAVVRTVVWSHDPSA